MGVLYSIIKWERTSTSKKSGEESNLILSALCSESGPGNTDNSMSSTSASVHLAQTRPASSVTRESKDMLSTESLKSVLAASALISACSALTGLDRTPVSSSMKLFSSTPIIKPSDVTHVSIGSSQASTRRENLEDSLPLERRPEVCFREATRLTSSDHLSVETTRRETKRSTGDTEATEYVFVFFFTTHNNPVGGFARSPNYWLVSKNRRTKK